MEQNDIFIRIFGNSPKVRIINYMIKVRGLDFSLSDIARSSGVGWATLNRLWRSLEDSKIVIHTRVIGRAKLYKLNEDNPLVNDLIELYKKLLIQETKDYFKKSKIISKK